MPRPPAHFPLFNGGAVALQLVGAHYNEGTGELTLDFDDIVVDVSLLDWNSIFVSPPTGDQKTDFAFQTQFESQVQLLSGADGDTSDGTNTVQVPAVAGLMGLNTTQFQAVGSFPLT